MQHRFVKVGDAFLFHTYINRRQTVSVITEIYDFPHITGVVKTGRSSFLGLPRPKLVFCTDNLTRLGIVMQDNV